jgi:hypothetical protein
MNAIFVMNSSMKILNVKDALLFATLPALIAFILLITAAAPCVDFNGLVFQLVGLIAHKNYIFYH